MRGRGPSAGTRAEAGPVTKSANPAVDGERSSSQRQPDCESTLRLKSSDGYQPATSFFAVIQSSLKGATAERPSEASYRLQLLVSRLALARVDREPPRDRRRAALRVLRPLTFRTNSTFRSSVSWAPSMCFPPPRHAPPNSSCSDPIAGFRSSIEKEGSAETPTCFEAL